MPKFSLAATDAECARDIAAIQAGYSVKYDRANETSIVGRSDWKDSKKSTSVGVKVGTGKVNVGLDVNSTRQFEGIVQTQHITHTETNKDSFVGPSGGESIPASSSHPTRTTTTTTTTSVSGTCTETETVEHHEQHQ